MSISDILDFKMDVVISTPNQLKGESAADGDITSEWRNIREDARASVSDQQMRNVTPRYPVDRYLVESSKKFDMVNIIDDDIWNIEPVLKPEDEIMLRKLHEMLQSTSDDLKLLSGELSKFHEPGVQVKMPPTPLDEEFNEKVHIEEVVNAKFHGYQIVEKPSHPVPEYKPRNDVKQTPVAKAQQPKVHNIAHASAQRFKKPAVTRNLGISRTTFIQINDNENSVKTENLEKLNNGKVVSAPAIAYNEFSYKYEEPKLRTPRNLHVQEMPSINIRSELKEQKVLILDIIPDVKETEKANMISKNIAVVAIQHETAKRVPTETNVPANHNARAKPSVRKVSKLSTCESSGSMNNNNSHAQVKLKSQNPLVASIRSSPKCSARSDRKKVFTKKESEKPSHSNLDEWRKKLNTVYGVTNVKKKSPKPKSKLKITPKKYNTLYSNRPKPPTLNNTEYIPYSKLTIGGVRASDIEKEISDIPDKNDIPLSPILDRILSSRENSFSKRHPRKHKHNESPKVLTTSDENLLQEVLDIEITVSETLLKDVKKPINKPTVQNVSSESDKANDNDSYADDFEVDKSELSSQSKNLKSKSTYSDESQKYGSSSDDNEGNNVDNKSAPATLKSNIHDNTYTKTNLSFKSSVDVYEFVHLVDTQDSATQSNTAHKIYPKETQTSPRNDNIQPIHNDLWPSADHIAEVDNIFKMEKDFIKNLIVEEYGDLFEKNLSKPSTSKEVDDKKNISASQKDTQTSPAHVKHVMTSPTKTKTRTTSPFSILAVDHHTSPLIFVTNEDNVKVEIEDDLGISINLSSPRFSLRLPQNSREVLSNLEDTLRKNNIKNTTKTKRSTVSSSSSIDVDSSEISSLGEVKLKLRRKLRKFRLPSSPESTSSSIHSSDLQSGILPLRSEGEMSGNKNYTKHSKSEGETSFGTF